VANHVSSEKRARQEKKRRSVNRMKVSGARSAVKTVKDALTKGDKKGALDLFKTAQSKLMKVAKTSALTKKAAARKISRLAKQIASHKA
jgi:small subunit ribosomal protein S20